MKVTFKNQLGRQILLFAGDDEYVLEPNQEVVLNLQDDDCLYVDSLGQK